ncbi:hypothetical protein B0H14DRAFT_3616591 [Mycena olivaceomarginata]|nr:hypothetical protein B0H14DRAFT_3616591 [Mycena olivaceomarginata]
MSHTPGIYHRLALAQSFLYIISGSITSVLYGFGIFDSYIAVLALLTFVMLWATVNISALAAVPYTTRVDIANPLSRAGRHFVFISSFMIIWLLPGTAPQSFAIVLRYKTIPAILSFAAIFEGDPTKQTPVVADCVPDRFMKLRCIPAGMDVILAFVSLADFSDRLAKTACPAKRSLNLAGRALMAWA